MQIISGGQTGADQGGLLAARDLGVQTGGTAPQGWLTEDGPQELLLRSLGLEECSEAGYDARTRANVLRADGTLLVGPYRAGGSGLTVKIARESEKPVFHVAYGGRSVAPSEERISEFRDWLGRYEIRILNVAGNRESQSPGIQAFTRQFLVNALGGWPAG